MHGIIVVDKPKGYTSRDVVNVVSKTLHTKKVGHTGTLDPLATGVLVLCVGDYTKFVQTLTDHDKEYLATIDFGIETDTLDITGKVLQRNGMTPSKDDLLEALQKFIGVQEQEVPIYSAKKVNGKKLYEYARNHESVDLPKQQIEIKELELISFEKNVAVIRCVVSKGTYIRSLIRDLSHYLGVYGVMRELRRTKLGQFDLSLSFSIEQLKSGDINLQNFTSFLCYDVWEIKESDLTVVAHRNELFLDSTKEFVLVQYQKQSLALYQKHKDRYKPFLIFDKTL
jgi:tRNA pseudouridine55 synthase